MRLKLDIPKSVDFFSLYLDDLLGDESERPKTMQALRTFCERVPQEWVDKIPGSLSLRPALILMGVRSSTSTFQGGMWTTTTTSSTFLQSLRSWGRKG